MKKFKSSTGRIAISAATSSGTVFYRVTLDEAIEVARSENIILMQRLMDRGWNALDFETHLYGSAVIDDVLYLCDSDGYEIEVDGEMIDAESALDEYPLESLSKYIRPADKTVIRRDISTYELGPFDLDKVCYNLLDNGYNFAKIVSAAVDGNFIEI